MFIFSLFFSHFSLVDFHSLNFPKPKTSRKEPILNINTNADFVLMMFSSNNDFSVPSDKGVGSLLPYHYWPYCVIESNKVARGKWEDQGS